MIITCEQCTTQFQLADEKIPPTGARVRCSRCKHAFFVEPPGASDDSSAQQLAREALDGESDWEFNDEPAPPPRAPGAPEAPPRPAPAAEPGPAPTPAAELAPPAPERPPPARERPAAPPPPAAPAPEPAAAKARDAASAAVDDLLGAPRPASPSPRDAAEPGAAGGSPAAASETGESGVGDDLGTPESWDFFETGPDQGAGGRAPLGKMDLVPRWKLLEDDPEAQARETAAAAAAAAGFLPEEDRTAQPETRIVDDEAGARTPPLLRHAATALGWLATCALVAAALYGVAAHRGARAELALQRVGPVVAAELRGRWVENAAGGTLFVVSGRLRNEGPSETPFGPFGVRLLDAQGEPLPASMAIVGPRIPARELRELPPRRLAELQQQRAFALATGRMRAGQQFDFAAVFPRLPPMAARYELADVTAR